MGEVLIDEAVAIVILSIAIFFFGLHSITLGPTHSLIARLHSVAFTEVILLAARTLPLGYKEIA